MTHAEGSRVLRAETAPLALLAIVQYLWGDIGAMRQGAWSPKLSP